VSLDVQDLRTAKPSIQVAVTGFDTSWVKGHGQDRQTGWLFELDNPDRWERIEAEDAEAVQSTGNGPEPVLAPGERDAAVGRVDYPAAKWTWSGSAGRGDR
jgi:hypothetical protein